jgi:hypothetical protein
MNFTKLMRGVAMLCASSILWVSCKKEDSRSIDPGAGDVTNTSLKSAGARPDDPGKVAKVPMITSEDFLASKIANYFSTQPQIESARGSGGRDRSAPVVNITSPATGTVVSGTINVQVSASDNVGVASVVLKADGNLIGTSNIAPYNFSWNTTALSSGTHTLSATATDAAGNSKVSSVQVGYNVSSGSDITPPTVSITSPVNGSSVTSTITVTASASDNIGVSQVSFDVDGTAVSSDASAPYSFSLNSGTLSSGIHTITARAKDAAGNSNSNSIQVTVNTTVTAPTTLPSSAQLLMPPVANQGGEFSCVAFAAGYAARSAELFYKTGATSYNYGTNIFSPEFLYNQTKYFDCGSGTDILTALEFMKNTGICSWQSMPYSDLNGCSLLPTSSQTAEAGSYKISGYSSIYKTDVTAIKTMIVNKHPLTMFVNLDASFTDARPGFIWKSYSGAGGFTHALVICGYDDSKHAFKVMNSWGTGWGDAGFSWIDYDFLAQTGSTWVFAINP